MPTMNDTLAAANVPTDLPSIELIGACRAIRPPAQTVEEERGLLRHYFASVQLRTDPHVDLERRVELVRPGHLALDDLLRRIDLVLGSLEQELVVHGQDEPGTHVGRAHRGSEASRP